MILNVFTALKNVCPQNNKENIEMKLFIRKRKFFLMAITVLNIWQSCQIFSSNTSTPPIPRKKTSFQFRIGILLTQYRRTRLRFPVFITRAITDLLGEIKTEKYNYQFLNFFYVFPVSTFIGGCLDNGQVFSPPPSTEKKRFIFQ